MLMGAHVSIAGGLEKSITNAEKIGAAVVQTFASSPRSIRWKPYERKSIEAYLATKAGSQVKLHVFHGVYLINLAHDNPEYVQVCVDSLSYYQQLAGEIGALGTVFHIGSHKGKGLSAIFEQVVTAIGKVLEKTPPGVWLLLENTAGQSGVIGENFEELAQVIAGVAKQGVNTDHLGVCVDTQHAFASGYDIRSKTGGEAMLKELDRVLGLDRLQLVHVNDSPVGLGAKRDRHANLGEGEIGWTGLRHLLQHPNITHLPLVLEVPGNNRSGPRIEDIEQLKLLMQ